MKRFIACLSLAVMVSTWPRRLRSTPRRSPFMTSGRSRMCWSGRRARHHFAFARPGAKLASHCAGFERALTALAFAMRPMASRWPGGTVLAHGRRRRDVGQGPGARCRNRSLLGSRASRWPLHRLWRVRFYLESADQGARGAQEAVAPDFDRHISKVSRRGTSCCWSVNRPRWRISSDGGVSWKSIEVPYEGSLFGALVLRDGAWLIYGMRGNVLPLR